MGIRFAAIGLNHYHVYSQTDALLAAGAELAWFWGDEEAHRQAFGRKYLQAKLARSVDEILEDERVQLVVGAAVPDQRAGLGIEVMAHNKHYMCAKPGFTDLAQLAEVRQAQAQSGRKYLVYFGERFGNPATVKAGELVQAGAIGRVIQTIGFGPHRLLGHVPRPAWGDVRLFLTGTEGMIEIRKNVDLAGRPGGNHLFLVDKQGVHYLECQTEPLPFGRQLIHDIQEGTETAVSQAHYFRVSELALQAQIRARS